MLFLAYLSLPLQIHVNILLCLHYRNKGIYQHWIRAHGIVQMNQTVETPDEYPLGWIGLDGLFYSMFFISVYIHFIWCSWMLVLCQCVWCRCIMMTMFYILVFCFVVPCLGFYQGCIFCVFIRISTCTYI